jgi:23S rRNA (uracil1939-C5)-methyltransferase
MGRRLQGLFWNGQPERSNVILGPRTERISGEPAMRERFGGATVFYPPDAFCQNNPKVYAQIVAQVRGWVPQGADVLELYAGVGALGLSVLPRARRVRFNEVAPGSLAGLQMGIDALPPALGERTQVLPGRAGQWAAAVGDCDVLIVDPPRKGLEPEVLAALESDGAGPAELIYVSCGPEALIAEAAQLAPRWSLRELRIFDLFPWTGHVEAVARFTRA